MPKRRFAAVGLLATAVTLVLMSVAAPAHATFPGANGKFVFARFVSDNFEIYTSEPDGSNLTRLTTNPAFDAWPTWSADGRKIAFASNRDGDFDIYTMNADGSGVVNVSQNPAADWFPSLSPDGTKIAFTSDRVPNCCVPNASNSDIYLMNSDGSNQTRLTLDSQADESDPAFSPDGQRIAFSTLGWYYDFTVDEWMRDTPFWKVVNLDGTPSGGGWYGEDPSWSPDATKITYTDTDVYQSYSFIGVANADGSGPTSFATDAFELHPVWSPDGRKIVFRSDGGSFGSFGEYTINPDGTGRAFLSAASDAFDWQPVTPPGYARPRGSTPVNIRLVPAFRACTNPNASHGAPFNVSSCSPPTEESTFATTGHGDAGRMAGLVTFKEVGESPINPTNGDQADVQLTASITDVRNPDLSDYTGELRVAPVLRITDRQSGGTYSPPIHPATASDTPFGFTLACTTTTATNIGSTCSATTTADAVLPGVVREGKRSVWQLGKVEVYDGGADGDADTTGDNTLFATQGLFAP